MTPYYNKPTQEGLYQHFKAVAEAVDIEQILYNVPGRTACDMQADTVLRLAAIDNIVGIKEATGDIDRIRALVAGADSDFAILSGEDWLCCESMLEGGHGVISVTANVAPKLMRAMCDAALSGNPDEARKLDARLQPLHKGLFVESNPIPVKWALNQMGMIGPSTPATHSIGCAVLRHCDRRHGSGRHRDCERTSPRSCQRVAGALASRVRAE